MKVKLFLNSLTKNCILTLPYSERNQFSVVFISFKRVKVLVTVQLGINL